MVQYVPAWFDFNPSSPPKNTAAISPPVPASIALAEIRSSLINAAKRWNGDDDVNPHQAIFEVGPADNPTAVGPLHAILVRGVDGDQTYKYKIAIVASVRAFMATECAWERDNMQVGAGGKFTAAHEWGHAFGNPDHYVETSRNASLWARGIRDIARSPGCPYEFDAKGMMNGQELRPRCYDMWHLALWMADADGSFAGATNMAIRQGPYRYTTTVTPRTRDRSRFPVITRNAIQVGAVGLCDLFAYAPGIDGFNGGDGLYGASLESPADVFVICRVKMAVTFAEDEHKSYNGGKLFLAEVEDAIRRVFNIERRLYVRGQLAGRQVRARVLFSPRFIVRTFPTGSGANRTKYLNSMTAAPTTPAAYTAAVNALVTESPIHAEITAIDDPGNPGITNGAANPRIANLDCDDVEDQAVEIFGRLIGLNNPARAKPADYVPLIQALAPDFTHSTLEFFK